MSQDIVLKGTQQGWVSTGIRVNMGDEIHVTASGKIRFFAIGYERDPDGKDEHGKEEVAPNGHPAPGLVRNSLVFRIGDKLLQGGTNAKLIVLESGDLEMSNNDDYCRDNGGSWNIRVTCS